MKKLFIPFAATLLATSCGQKSEDESKNHYLWTKTFEISGKDTINITDGNNQRQGIWLEGPNKDTLVYLNDSGLYIPSGMSAKSLIQMLRDKKGYNRY